MQCLTVRTPKVASAGLVDWGQPEAPDTTETPKSAMNLKAIGQTVLTIVAVMIAVKFVKPKLPASISMYLP